MYLFVFGLCWVFTAAQPFLSCRRGLLPRAALHHGGWELLPIAGGCSPSWGVRGLLSISGLWGGLLPIAGGCCPPRGWGAALHRGGLGGCSPYQGIAPLWCLSLSCCGAPALGPGSVAVMHRLCCPTTCGVFLDQGSNPCPLCWQAGSQPLDHQGRPQDHF